MQLKTSPILAIESATALDNYRLALHGNKNVVGSLDGVSVTATGDNNGFMSVFGLNCQFFYDIVKCRDGKSEEQEIGIAHLEQEDDNIFLCRDRAFYYIDQNNVSTLQSPSTITCNESQTLLVTSYAPQSMHELLTTDSSVIVSNIAHLPSAVSLDKNSFLGRLDGQIRPLPLIESIINSVCSYTKQLILKTSKLDVKKVKSNQLCINPSKKAEERKGNIYYDQQDDKLKYFDGSRWRSFLFEEDE